MIRLRLRLFLLLALSLAGRSADAQSTAPSEPAPTLAAPSAEVRVWNRHIIRFRAGYGNMSPEDRARAVTQRISDLPDASLKGEVVVQEAAVGDSTGRMVFADHRPLFAILPGDTDPLIGENIDSLASDAAANLRDVLAARAESRDTSSFRLSLIQAALATLAFLVTLWLLQRLRRRLEPGMGRLESRVAGARMLGFDLSPHVHSLLKRAVDSVLVVLVLVATYLWLTFVFGLFPYTRPWGMAFGRSLMHALSLLGREFMAALPGLGMATLIFFITRFAGRMLSAVFRAAETGAVAIPGIHPETAVASRRIATWLLWLFAVIVAYPYLPGSETDVFKGVSVFAGVLISLGASGVVGQVMSGLVVVYSRAVRVGEYVKVDEHEGTVTEIGMLSTKILTPRREEITIPNTVLVGTTTTNYSRQEAEGGAVVRTVLTIGYDAPWRQVHAMLLAAADKTALVRKEPKPFVLQAALSDFFVEYALMVRIEHAAQRFQMLSQLNANIQDEFNRHGVQIMSPHFEGQPEDRIVVPPGKWHEAPASPPEPRA
jgi:small-conductance mechanosensitive channel